MRLLAVVWAPCPCCQSFATLLIERVGRRLYLTDIGACEATWEATK